MSMNKEDQQLDTGPLDEQAAYWLRVLRDEPTLEQHATFLKWMNASPRHVNEFAFAQEVDNRLQRFHRVHHVDVDALIERSKQERRFRQWRAWTARIAASIAVLGVLSAAVVIRHRTPETYITREKQHLIDLADGSVVALNAQSQMRVVFSDETRDLYLERGQGIFRVRHDAKRPFRVHAGTAVVEAIGTQFDVCVAGDRTMVAVVEGVVQLKSGSSTTSATEEESIPVGLPILSAGQSATIRHDGYTEEVKAIDVVAATAWRQAQEQLEFKNEPLAQIASEFNRHNAMPKLRIQGDELRARRFILVFKNSSPQSLLNYMAQDPALEFVREGDDILIRERNR
jgi:transmembrane sensor